ncbi:MAG: class I SAM-dependent methyltransferase [Chlamydiae bacterium]|nr:class I SAM-dependent methyltransferase [Chlamydiota bacterium]
MSSTVTQSALVDYVIPPEFSYGTSCLEVLMGDEAVLRAIDLAKLHFIEGQDKLKVRFPAEFIREKQIFAAKSSSGISPHIKSLIDTYKGKGTALDVGCGVGLNSIALLKMGWNVCALDLYKEVLDVFKEHVSKVRSSVESKESNFGKYRIINKDITDMTLKASCLDLVLAYDVLSYLSPDSLIPTIRKIYAALLPGGIFMGSLLVNRELSTDEDVLLMVSMRALNAYSYTDPAVIANIFRYAGFHMEVCTFHPLIDSSHPGMVVSFVARKLSV